MRSSLKSSLGGLWLFISLVSLILPVFIPSSADPYSFVQNVIGVSTVTMFVLSFPISLFGMPLLYVSQVILGVDPQSIGGMYLNLFLLFVLGLVQWFWIVPNAFNRGSHLQILELQTHPEMQLSEHVEPADFAFFDSESRTPLERAIRDDNDHL